MIKFFRKIRQNLLIENKTGKYFKYAVGEIILVVIGILIALQINNWNENRKNKIAEADYYCRILDDFELNEKLIDETSNLITHRIKLCKELIIDLNNIPNERSKILNDFVDAMRQDVFVPSTITFDDLTVDAVLRSGANTIVRGLRDSSDFNYEVQMAGMNSTISPEAYES